MSASVKIELRDGAGRTVQIEIHGHQNEHASGILKEAEQTANRLAVEIGLKRTT